MNTTDDMIKVAIVESQYTIIRLFEILLKIEGYHVTQFGRLQQLQKSTEHFDLLIINPGFPETCPGVLLDISKIQPGTRKIIITIYEEVLVEARKYKDMQSLLMPFSRRIFMAVLKNVRGVLTEQAAKELQCEADGEHKGQEDNNGS